jgi:hypothetical protein
MFGRRGRVVVGVGLLAAVLAASPAGSQTDRVMVGAPPAPDQSLRLKMTQAMNFTLTPLGDPPPGAPAGPMQVTGSTVTTIRQQVGKPDADGRLQIDLTYEDVSQEMKMNDKPVPMPADAAEALKGKTVTMWVDSTFQVVDVKAPEGFPIPADQLKQLMVQLMGSVPHQEMRIGETVTVPLSMPLPIPLPGAQPPVLKGETKTTLVKVAPQGNDQIATLEQTVEAALDSTNDMPGGKLRIVFKVKGSGTTLTAVKAGVAHSSTMKSDIEGQFEPQGAAKGPPAVKIAGAMNMTIEKLP